ncbi:Pet127-domain-containing protein [Hypoxylon trugodes]|uniref:Pet127-domain-containing protein n=1 Tax=Hypoxylon trugodes TaxID=326681 RepID=UPI00219D1812|nr:Pet127-domain-containing protein [Hypoxylon trugodes]KAI1391103.1 Pet127-domain-containing protein [Hypoxylon trugodes]
MLRLRSCSAYRIGSSYICASCYAASHPARLSALRHASISSHHVRSLSSTSRRATPATESTTEPTVEPTLNPTIPPTDESNNIDSPTQKTSKKKKKKKKVEAKNSPPAAKPGHERQLKVLEGALEALKNVLAAQNISVDQISKPSTKDDHEDTTKAKTKPQEKEREKAKAKPKPKAKTAKAEPPKSQKSKDSLKKESVEKVSESTDTKPRARPGRVAKRRQAQLAKSKQSTSKKQSATGGSTEQKATLSVKEFLSKNYGSIQDLRESVQAFADGRGINDINYGNFVHPPPKPLPEQKPPSTQTQTEPTQPNDTPITINKLDSKGMLLSPIQITQPQVSSLSYGLERVLFNPGVYFLQDPRSRVYNFDPYLSEIMPIQEFDFNALKQYVTSSKDSTLIGIAKEHGKKYTGSTSSMTSMLSHFHYLLSSWRNINTTMLSRTFIPDSLQFTRIMRGPAAVFLHWKDGTYAIDADKEYDTANILSMLGKSMEKLLTLSKEEYERYRHTNSDQITEEERNAEEAFHYTGFKDFMMRSQLDAHDDRVPGTGMFDLKTRAVVSIRMDAKGFHKGLGYEIRNRFGQWESFEREYYDMIRSAFLKYSLQVRMGRMDGIFVAFHNTQRIFGFQYIPLEEMDLALHGTSNLTLGDREFKLSLSLLNDILNRVSAKFPERSLRLHFETRTSINTPFMYIFAKPVTPEDISEVQDASKASVEAFERDILGMAGEEAKAALESTKENNEVVDEEDEDEELPSTQEISSLTVWRDVRQMVEDAVGDDEVGVGAVREAIEDALEQSGLLHAKSSTEARGYVDALLVAITSNNPSIPTESSPSLHKQEAVIANDSPLVSTQGITKQELESPGERQSAVDDGSHPDQPQIREEIEGDQSTSARDTENQPEEGDQISGDHLDVQSGSVVRQGGELPVNIDYPDNQIGEPEGSGNGAVSQRPFDTGVGTEEEEDEEEEDDDESDEVDDEIEIRKGLSNTSNMSPLKELIVRMTQTINAGTISDEVEDSLDDASKLKEFERILSELIARSRDERNQSQTNDSSLTADTGAIPEPIEKETIETDNKEATGAQDPTPSSPEPTPETPTLPSENDESELFGMVLSIKNIVNGSYVTRPEELKKRDHWNLEYNIEEIEGQRAQTIYRQIKSRRQKVHKDTGDKEAEWYQMFRGQLEKYTLAGRRFREKESENERKKNQVNVVGQKPQTWNEVFGSGHKVKKS